MDIIGQHFKYSPQLREITFFEVKGSFYNGNREWVVSIWTDAAKTKQVPLPVTKRNFSVRVVSYLVAHPLVNEDTLGRGCLVISSRMAVALWLEGVMQLSHLESAREFDTLVVIPELRLGHYCLPVVIKDERKLTHHFEWIY